MSPPIEHRFTSSNEPARSDTTLEPEQVFSSQAQFFHQAVARWLARSGVTIACGRWSDGAISDILLQGNGSLLPARYGSCFAGVREVRLPDQPHHLACQRLAACANWLTRCRPAFAWHSNRGLSFAC
jgi:hypothetical protein